MADEIALHLAELRETLKQVGSERAKFLDHRSFVGRLSFQKLTYWAQRFDVWQGKPVTFGRYVRGPYSPRLAVAYFAIENDAGTNPPSIVLDEDVRHAYDLLASWLDKGPLFLEAAASIDAATLRLAKDTNRSPVDCLEEARIEVGKRKSFLSAQVLDEARDELREQYEQGLAEHVDWLH